MARRDFLETCICGAWTDSCNVFMHVQGLVHSLSAKGHSVPNVGVRPAFLLKSTSHLQHRNDILAECVCSKSGMLKLLNVLMFTRDDAFMQTRSDSIISLHRHSARGSWQ